jgi:hypothetical protein
MVDPEDPIVIDAREGISAEALDQLRKATRIVIGIKDHRTAVLGFWRPQVTDSDEGDDDRMGALLLERYGPGPVSRVGDDGLIRFAHRESAVWPLTIDARQDERWSRIVAMLQPGDLVLVDSTRWSRRMPGLEIRHGDFTAFVPLHGAERARLSRSVLAI